MLASASFLTGRPPGHPNGRYTVIKKLEDGSFSKLYLASDNNNEKKVVIKKIRLTDNWADELRSLEFLNYHGVTELIDNYFYGRFAYIVVPYIPGYSLEEYIYECGSFDEKDAIIIFRKMLKCVKKLHDIKMVHLDIKLANFMITLGNIVNDKRVVDIKLIDYGHADFCYTKKKWETCNYGTPRYTCPEEYHDMYDTSSDIWSLGICFHQLLSKKLPYDGDYYNN